MPERARDRRARWSEFSRIQFTPALLPSDVAQSVLLDVMEKRQATVSGQHYKLPPLFMVLATRNPI